jgi:MreB/Mbl protein
MTQMIRLFAAASTQPSQHLLPTRIVEKNRKHKRRAVKPQHEREHLQFHIGYFLAYGVVNTRIYSQDRGVVVNEPSAVALDDRTGEVRYAPAPRDGSWS